MPKLFRGVALALCILVQAAWSQVPEAPRDCDIAVRLLPAPSPFTAEQEAHMMEHPLYELIDRVAVKELGFEPFHDFRNSLEGTMVAGIVPRADGSSSLVEFFRDHDARRSHRSMISELDSLIADLDDYKNTEGKYPVDYQLYVDEHRYYEPYLPYGVEYGYQALNEGEGFSLTVTYGDGADLARFGPPPSYRSGEERKNWNPEKPPAPLNFVLAVKSRDLQLTRKISSQMMGEPRDGFWRSQLEGLPLIATVRGDWWLLADRTENMGPFLEALEGRAPGLSYNPDYREVGRYVDLDAPFTMFVNAPNMVDSLMPMILEEGKLDPQLARMVGPMGYSVQSLGGMQARIEVFVGVRPPEDTSLASFFAATENQDPEMDLNMGNVPWDAANVFALDLTAFKELLDASIALYPEAAREYDTGQDVVAGMLGLDAEAGFNKLLQGPALISFERIDFFLNGVAAFVDKMESESEGEGDPVTSSLGVMPVTVAARVPSSHNREALLKMLRGDDPGAPTDLYGVEVYERGEGRIQYAQDGEWIYLSGGHTGRLMRNLLAAAKGRKETLSSLPSWTSFQLGRKGRFLGFGHQKLDPIYSIVKGLLLFMGADFRPMATEVGRLRDYHSVMTAVPDGFLMVGEIVYGDGR